MPQPHLTAAAPAAPLPPAAPAPSREFTARELHELLEKNLKWSQIIYEQTRKINRKLWWGTAAEWLRVVIILVPLGLAVWLLPNAWRSFQARWFGPASAGKPNNLPLEQLLKFLPLTPEQQAQFKALVK